MSLTESSPCLDLGPGLTMRFFLSPPSSSSPRRRFNETTYDPSIPGSAPLDVPPHWHALHDEWLTVIEGCVDITLGADAGARAVRLEPGMQAAFAPRRTVHAIKGHSGVKTVLREEASFTGERERDKEM